VSVANLGVGIGTGMGMGKGKGIPNLATMALAISRKLPFGTPFFLFLFLFPVTAGSFVIRLFVDAPLQLPITAPFVPGLSATAGHHSSGDYTAGQQDSWTTSNPSTLNSQ